MMGGSLLQKLVDCVEFTARAMANRADRCCRQLGLHLINPFIREAPKTVPKLDVNVN
jgi:hypothetical protein